MELMVGEEIIGKRAWIPLREKEAAGAKNITGGNQNIEAGI